MVRMLLGKGDVNPNGHDVRGQTSISRAPENGHEDVAKLLAPRNYATQCSMPGGYFPPLTNTKGREILRLTTFLC